MHEKCDGSEAGYTSESKSNPAQRTAGSHTSAAWG